MSWRGEPRAYDCIRPGPYATGGGSVPSHAIGRFAVLKAGPYATGGGRVPSTGDVLQGYGGCGGPGPGALIGLGGGLGRAALIGVALPP